MSLKQPLIAWGLAVDIDADMSNVNAVGVTTGVADPFGGTDAYTLDDDSGSTIEGKAKAFVATSTRIWFDVFIKQGTAAISTVDIYDDDASILRARFALTWSGLTIAVTNGAGLTLPVISLGDGWYFFRGRADGIVAGSIHHIRINGSTASGTGSTTYYLRKAVLFDFPDAPMSFPLKREGSRKRQLRSGLWSTWDVGDEFIYKSRVRFIPKDPTATPYAVSGWDGDGPAIGVNTGVERLLVDNGAADDSLVIALDRAICAVNKSAVLIPVDESVSIEQNGMRAFPLTLSAVTPFEGVGT